MDQVIALQDAMDGDAYPCEVCGAPAAWMVQDVLVHHQHNYGHVSVHSSHRFCEQHMRPPIIYRRGELEFRDVKDGSRFLGRGL